MAEVDLSALHKIPNLPGYGFKRRQKQYHKAQTFNIAGGIRIEQKEGVTYERPKMVQVAKDPDNRRIGSLPESSTHAGFKETLGGAHTQMPAWDALDRHVLRFYGYFQEAVIETNLENYRNRHVIIYYYLEDDTCHVVEKKKDNSGIPQGQLIRRHRFPAPGGGYLTWQHLQCGTELNIYGKAIALTDCDAFTRDFMRANGAEQMEPLVDQPPDDAFSMSQRCDKTMASVPKTHERQYREVQLGGGHVNADMQQFMEYDRKVCRFYAVTDDLMLPQHERRPFVILYFLSDDTLEIREQYPLNCGRDNFPIFFRRAKMPRGDKATVTGPLDQPRGKDDYISILDFSVGKMHKLMGMGFYIYDADDFTRRYFEEDLGQQLGPCEDVRLPERTVPRPPTPPYNGYGSLDDSMTSVKQLIGKPPRKDFEKLYKQDGKVLRFTAQLITERSEDADRLFVLNFHMFDDTLSIHEPPQRNLGILTGKFLQKDIHTNQVTGDLFKPEDFAVGSVVKVYNREFQIVDMDEYTRKFYEDGGIRRRYDLAAVLEKVRESMRQQFPLVRDIFRRFDADCDGVITIGEFKKALEKWGFQVSEDEAMTLMKHFDAREDGKVSYNEFCDALLDEDYTTEMMKMKPPLKEVTVDGDYAQRAKQQLAERQETEKVRTAVRNIGDVIYKHSATFQKLFKEFSHMTHAHRVSCEQIGQALEQIGRPFDIEDVRRCVFYVLGPDTDLNAVPYFDFLKAVVTSFHDLAASR